MPWRLVRILVRLVLVAVLLLAGFVAWAEFWPAPRRPAFDGCAGARPGCIAVSGRVLYHTTFAPGRHAHVVLLSRRSTTLPGVVTAEFPRIVTRAPAGFGFGDWVTIYGARTIGSHHEHDVHIEGFETVRSLVRCGDFDAEYERCVTRRRHDG